MSPEPRSPARLLSLELNPRLRAPAYRQIAGQVQRLLGTRRLQAGTRLPTVRALARRLGVNFNTVARAYRLLAHTGSVSTQPGRGTFVLALTPPRRSRLAALRGLTADFISDAQHLGFTHAQIMSHLQRQLVRRDGALPPGDSHE